MSRFGEADDPRRRALIQALAAGLFNSVLPGGRVLAADVFGSTPSKLPAGQSIYRISGTVLVNGMVATLQTHIGANDTVETSRDAEIVFVVGENSMLLRANSRVELRAERNEPLSILISGLRLLTGKLLSVSRNRTMQVNTLTATAGIRGTGFYVESDPQQTYFCTCYGTMDVAANDDKESRDTVVSQHHDKALYILAGAKPGQSIRRAPFINHADQELMLIETLVGRKLPFNYPQGGYTPPPSAY